jgi:hypothetical protein
VFRSLQEADELRRAASVLAGVDREPELILWGQRIAVDTTAPTPEIHHALDELEPTHAQQTEPDVVLRVPDWGWIFFEAKLSSPTSTYAGKPAKLEAWRRLDETAGLFDARASSPLITRLSRSSYCATSRSRTPSARQASGRS